MTFKIMAYVMTVAGCLLGFRFTLAGASILREWGLEATDGSLVMCRRIGVCVAGNRRDGTCIIGFRSVD